MIFDIHAILAISVNIAELLIQNKDWLGHSILQNF